MASYSTNEFRGGLKVLLDGDPCIILENEFVKPGKGQAFNRVKIRNLKTGRVIERTFKSGESVEAADVMDVQLQFLYSDGEFWHFMDTQSYEQQAADAGQRAKMIESDDCHLPLPVFERLGLDQHGCCRIEAVEQFRVPGNLLFGERGGIRRFHQLPMVGRGCDRFFSVAGGIGAILAEATVEDPANRLAVTAVVCQKLLSVGEIKTPREPVEFAGAFRQ